MRTAGIGRQWVLDEKIQGLEREMSWVMRRLDRTRVYGRGCRWIGETEVLVRL